MSAVISKDKSAGTHQAVEQLTIAPIGELTDDGDTTMIPGQDPLFSIPRDIELLPASSTIYLTLGLCLEISHRFVACPRFCL